MAESDNLPHPAPASSMLSGLGSKPAPATPVTAKDKLRAFEDKHLGKNTVRHNGEIERGSGSPFRNLTPEQQREHAAIERQVAAEVAVNEAAAALAVAQTAHATSVAEAGNAAKVADDAAATSAKIVAEEARPEPKVA